MFKVGSIFMMRGRMAVNPVAERASNIRGGIELPLILGNVAAVKGWILPVLYELSQLK
jgi:hypothetical protein